MKTTISYKGLPETEADAKAIADIKEYLTKKQWNVFMQIVKTETCETIDFYLNFAGVRGFPIFAFMRKYKPAEYAAWYASLPEA